MQDIRDILFRDIEAQKFRAVLIAERDGILSGVDEAVKTAQELGVEWNSDCREGDRLFAGRIFAELIAVPKQLAMAEERIIGTLSKTSGIATSARRAVELADGELEIVSGSWKKMPPCIKNMVRLAITTGGASFRICEPPMLYMDKNFITMLGSVKSALFSASEMTNVTKIVQIRGLHPSVEVETREALAGGASILMVDTGNLDDVDVCQRVLADMKMREHVRVAFAGNVKIADIPSLGKRGIDKLCIGKEIVDAPLLDMKLNVVGVLEQ